MWSFFKQPFPKALTRLSWMKRGFTATSLKHLELDLYEDIEPFNDGTLPEAISFYQPVPNEIKRNLPPLLMPTRKILSGTNVSQSFFLVNKESGEMLDDLVLTLAKSFASKTFYIVSSGFLDVLASGIVLLCCGKSMDSIHYFDALPHTYQGLLKLGQITPSYDLKFPVQSYQPWKHVTDDDLKATAKDMTGDVYLPPSPFIVKRSRKQGQFSSLKERPDMSDRPFLVHELEISRKSPSSSLVGFNLVSDSTLAPESFVHELGKRLGCGAILLELHRSQIGEYGVEFAWNSERIRRAFENAKTGILQFPDDPEEARISRYAQRYFDRVIGCSWHHFYSTGKRQKMKPFEKRLRKQERLRMEEEGLISEEEIMKRKLKKKAVKLVANLNVPDIEKVFEKMMEE